MIKNNNKKWLILLIGLALSVLIALVSFGWQYAINRPNYRDLQNAYKDLKLPADWQKVSETSNKGTFGLFCWQIGGEECPYIINEFLYPLAERNATNVMGELKNILYENNYELRDNSYGLNCSDDSLMSKEYSCYIVGVKKGIVVSVNISSSSLDGQNGNWARVTLNKTRYK